MSGDGCEKCGSIRTTSKKHVRTSISQRTSIPSWDMWEGACLINQLY